MNRDEIYKQKRYEKQSNLWGKNYKKMEQARLRYDEKKYTESELLWSKLVDDLKDVSTLNPKDEKYRQKCYAHAFCFRILCLIQFDEKQAFESENFTKFVELYSTLAPEPTYDFFYEKVILQLGAKHEFEKMKSLIFAELPFLHQRSLNHQAITKTMMAQLVMNDKLSLPWPGMVVSYLNSALKLFPKAYLLLINHLLQIGDLAKAEAKIAEAKTTSLGRTHQSRLLYYQARYHCHPDNPQIDMKKTVALLEETIKFEQIPQVCYKLAEFYDKNPDFKVAPDHIIQLYKLAARTLPEAAHSLALKYIQNKDMYDLEKAKEWYEAAVKFKYPASCYGYAILLSRNPDLLDKCLELLLIAQESFPQAKFLYIKLRLSYLIKKDIFFGKQIAPQGNILKKEGRKFYRDLMLLKPSESSRAELQLIAGIIQEFILKDMKLAIDHYRAAAEYGSEIAHDKSFYIYCVKLLSDNLHPDEEKYYIRTLQSIIDSMKFFYNKPIPDWALPFNMDKFKQSVGAHFQECTGLKIFVEDYKTTSPLNHIRSQPTSEKNKIIDIVNLNYDSIDAENTAELVRYAGQLAHKLIAIWGEESVDFLHEKIVFLLSMVVNKLKSKTDHFNLWSLMSIFEGCCYFKIQSDHNDFIDPLLYIMNFIRGKLNLFGSWKLIMLLESTKNLCYETPGVPNFIETIITHTLTNWPKLFTEIDGDIRLSYILAILDNHYHFITKKNPLKLLLLPILEKIINAEVSQYELRLKVVKDCFFTLSYFHDLQIIDMKNHAPLLHTLKAHLLKSQQKTTCSRFQKNIVNFISQYFCSNLLESGINCIELKEEKIVFTKPMDLGLTFSVPNPQTKARVLIDVIIEADGTPHFWIPITTMQTKPTYDLNTKFYTHVIKQQGVNIIRMEYFNWSSLTLSQRYAFFQEEFAKLGLVFSPFLETKPIQSDPYEDEDEQEEEKSTFQSHQRQHIYLENGHGNSSSLWWRSSFKRKPDFIENKRLER